MSDCPLLRRRSATVIHPHALATAMSARIRVTHYTDPWSVWCWAIEPQLLRLRERHGGQLDFTVRVGAIHETPVGPDFPRDDIRRMFAAARRASGMPLEPDAIDAWVGTTHRAGIACKAATLVAPEKAARYLRRLREAAMVEGRNIEDLKEQEAVAREVGISPVALLEALESDEATREFYGDQAEGRMRGVTGFPTVTFANAAGLEVGVGGFQPTEAYEAALLRVAAPMSGGSPHGRPSHVHLVDEPPPDVVDVLRRNGRLATVEVAEVFDWLEDVATARLQELELEGLVQREERGGGLFWMYK